MKRQMTLRSLLAITCLLLGLSLHAQVVTIHVATAGTLSSYIASNKKDLITGLTLTGDLNGTDIRYIREMAGSDVNGNVSSGMLSVLDISGANIVKGGNTFYSSYYSNDNAIGEYMFHNCTQLTSISIPDSITSIAYSAFDGCRSLREIIVSKGNSSYSSGDGVLFNKDKSFLISCPNSKSNSYTIPNSVTSIRSSAFQDCSRLTSITIPNSVTWIGTSTFQDCSGLTSIIIPNSVSAIGSSAFSGCSGLTSVTIGYSVRWIYEYSFYGCSGLISVTIGNSVTSIANYAFYGCTGLSSITIPNSVTSIGRLAFYSCSRLTSVSIPKSVTSIGGGVFAGCSSLAEILVSEENNSYSSVDGVLFNKDKSTLILFPFLKSKSYTIPDGVTSIYSSAFSGCSGLTSISIPNSVTSIGDRAFSYCSSLSSVTIPNNVKIISDYAFEACSGLKEIHNNNATPQIIKSSVFQNMDKNTCKLFVPKGSYSSYWVAPIWGDFTNIIEEDVVTSLPKAEIWSNAVYSEGESIVIEGAESGEIISIYTESGALVQTTQATGETLRINVPGGHTYLIKTAGKTFKIAL